MEALYCGREARPLLRLWGFFDEDRAGWIDGYSCDRALALFVDAELDQLSLMRRRE